MPALCAARHRGFSGLGAVTKGTPLRAVLSQTYQPHPANRVERNGLRAAIALSRHVERGLHLATSPPSPSSPSANNRCALQAHVNESHSNVLTAAQARQLAAAPNNATGLASNPNIKVSNLFKHKCVTRTVRCRTLGVLVQHARTCLSALRPCGTVRPFLAERPRAVRAHYEGAVEAWAHVAAYMPVELPSCQAPFPAKRSIVGNIVLNTKLSLVWTRQLGLSRCWPYASTLP
eukprot:363925-Chlamydomonas_euryale.AAC.8